MSYLALRHLHLLCVVLSASGFLLRGFWMFIDSPRLQQRWVRIVPHCIDTLLLASALGLALMSHQFPFVADWLTAKLLALLVYILCGTMALKRGRSKRQRGVFFVLALLVLAYIIAVALTRNPYLAW